MSWISRWMFFLLRGGTYHHLWDSRYLFRLKKKQKSMMLGSILASTHTTVKPQMCHHMLGTIDHSDTPKYWRMMKKG